MLKLITKHTTPFALFITVAILSWGCRKDVLEIRPYPVSLTELSLFLGQVPDPGTSTSFHLNALDEDKMLITPSGIRLFLTDVDHLFATKDANPTSVAASTCSDLKIEVNIATSRGDMLARNLPTSTVDDKILESVGMVEIKVFCGSTELQLLPGRSIKVQFPSNEVKQDLVVYAGTSNDQGFAGWENTGQDVFYADWPNPGGGTAVLGYEVIVSQLGWVNCARELAASNLTPFCANLQPGYTGLNTQAYLVFENIKSVVPLEFDNVNHTFCFPNVPAGYPVRVVSVAKLDADFWLGAISTETGTNSILPVQPIKKEAQEILGYLRGL